MIELDELFSVHANTMSIHLREKLPPMAKHGQPGNWLLSKISTEPLTADYLLDLADAIMDLANEGENSFIEDDTDLVRVVQLKHYRIVITYPPFSDAHEITVVRPTIQRSIDAYDLVPKLLKRLDERAEGILIAGAPGHGKSTFAAALAMWYADKNKIIKTIEKPRDLQLDERVTQFTILPQDVEKLADVLLLMRPDYVIFDEIRKNLDFTVYSDMRLAGVGLVGVIHATQPIDAIQRFVSRTELGIIPSVIDTVIFIRNGEVETVLSIKMVVKTPTGFTDEGLARPVIEVRDFLDGKSLYEIFSFGEQVVVVPTTTSSRSTKREKTRKKANGEGTRLPVREVLVEVLQLFELDESVEHRVEQIAHNTIDIYLPQHIIDAKVGLLNVELHQLESRYDIYINFLGIAKASENLITNYQLRENKKHVFVDLGFSHANQTVQLLIGPQIILDANTDMYGVIKLSRKKASTKRLERMIEGADEKLKIRLVE